MDEMTLVRDLADDTPLPDAAALAAVRSKLMVEIAPRRRRKFRVVGMTSVGVAAAAAVALVVTSLSGTPRGPDQAVPPPTVQAPKVLNAAAVLDYAAEAALTGSVPRPDQYVYMKTVTRSGTFEQWSAVDGKRSGHIISSIPEMPGGPTPPCLKVGLSVPGPHGDKKSTQCVAEGGYLAADPQTAEETMRFVQNTLDPGAPPDPKSFVKEAFAMPMMYMLSPQLKAAVFRALKTIRVPGQSIVVREHEHDLMGREGIGLLWQYDGHDVHEFIFDPKTYQLLGTPRAAITTLKAVDHVKQR
jgi:hypothetical protein